MDFILRQFRLLVNIFLSIIEKLFYPNQIGYLPVINNNLLLMPAIQLSEKIKSGQLKSEDLINVFIERCKAVNPELNAIVDENYDEALNEARKADEIVQRKLNGTPAPDDPAIDDLPFFGVPFTAKDSLPVKGKKYSAGTYYRKDMISSIDCESIQRLKKNGGAIFLGLTNVPELVLWMDSFNRVYGQTNNPYDKSRIPGGSSGGEAALVSAAGSVIGIGSDIAGSIRGPSHYCGVFGHFTTSTAVTIDEIFPPVAEKRRKMLSIGPLCRYASDLRPMVKLLAGDKLNLPNEPLNYSKLTVYYLPELDDPIATPVDYEIKNSLNKVVKYFMEKGTNTLPLNVAKNEKNSFYNLRYARAFFDESFNDPASGSLLKFISQGKNMNPFLELLKCALGINDRYTAGVLCFGIFESFKTKDEKIIKLLNELRDQLHQLLGNDSVLICPTLPEVAPKHSQSLVKSLDWIYTFIWNTMHVAITTVPMGLDRNGMPFNLQIVVSPSNDNLSIQVAEELEKQFGGWTSPSEIKID